MPSARQIIVEASPRVRVMHDDEVVLTKAAYNCWRREWDETEGERNDWAENFFWKPKRQYPFKDER